jgi:hypothetical protein
VLAGRRNEPTASQVLERILANTVCLSEPVVEPRGSNGDRNTHSGHLTDMTVEMSKGQRRLTHSMVATMADQLVSLERCQQYQSQVLYKSNMVQWQDRHTTHKTLRCRAHVRRQVDKHLSCLCGKAKTSRWCPGHCLSLLFLAKLGHIGAMRPKKDPPRA